MDGYICTIGDDDGYICVSCSDYGKDGDDDGKIGYGYNVLKQRRVLLGTLERLDTGTTYSSSDGYSFILSLFLNLGIMVVQ